MSVLKTVALKRTLRSTTASATESRATETAQKALQRVARKERSRAPPGAHPLPHLIRNELTRNDTLSRE